MNQAGNPEVAGSMVVGTVMGLVTKLLLSPELSQGPLIGFLTQGASSIFWAVIIYFILRWIKNVTHDKGGS